MAVHLRSSLAFKLWVGVCLVTSGGWLQADPPKTIGKSETPSRQKNSGAGERPDKELLQPLNEAAALKFAAEHHPELAALLKQMEKAAPREYRLGLTDVERSRQRLERTRERAPDRYPLELSEWKLSSQIRLLAARLTMGEDPSLVAELTKLVGEREDVRTRILKEDRERTQIRLERLSHQLTQRQQEREARVEREVQNLLDTANAASAKVAERRQNAEKSPAKNRSNSARSTSSAVKVQAPAKPQKSVD